MTRRMVRITVSPFSFTPVVEMTCVPPPVVLEKTEDDPVDVWPCMAS